MPGKLHALFDLSGRVALVTGGSRGLGLQIAEALCEFGAAVTLVARKADELEAAVAHLAAQGGRAEAIPADLSTPQAAAALIEQGVARHGRLDILVNNAGATWGAPAEDYPLDGWRKVIDLNVTGLFLLTQAAAKHAFLPQGAGAVVNVASIEGLQGHHHSQLGTVAYNAAKGAVVNMTRALAAEWGPRNIRVNALAPGYFPSKMTKGTLEAVGADLIGRTPLGRLGGPDDLKGAALLLASDAGAHITGQIVVVDGGMTVI
jgi:NAD(P)-dependent dehydrogenase (short-subunit alcohol dehydrogenase family)